jgi:hypothetical protein
MPITLLRDYGEENGTDDMQHTAALSDVNFSVVFTKLAFLQKCSYESIEVFSNHKSSGLYVQRVNKQTDP